MTTEGLKNVENFTISNEFGSIKFLGKTDLTNVDLAKIVTIKLRTAEVYNDNDPIQLKAKPPVGQKLNKPAEITLNNFILKQFKNQEIAEVYLQRQFQKSSQEGKPCKLLSYNLENRILKFEVEHFTNYGFKDEEDEDQEEEQVDMYSDEDRPSESIIERSIVQKDYVQEPTRR